SRVVDWEEVAAGQPEVVISMPCGMYAEQAAKEAMDWRERIAPLGARIVAVDAAAYFSRPGPRLVEGSGPLGHLLPTARVPPPARPPRCPPIEMFGTEKVISRFSPIHSPRPLSISEIPRRRRVTAAAPISPKIAPEAPTVGALGSSSRAPKDPARSETR